VDSGTRSPPAIFAYEVVETASQTVTCTARQTVVSIGFPDWKAVPMPEQYRSALSEYLADNKTP